MDDTRPQQELHLCVLCGGPISQDRAVATTTGEYVHITCANRDARAAYRKRTIQAVTTCILACAIILSAIILNVSSVLLVVLVITLPIGHAISNSRWWRLTWYAIRRGR